MPNILERVVRAAGDQFLNRNQLRNLHVDAGRAMFGNGADDVALGEHADGGIAFGPDDVLDHKRADIAGAHQLGRYAHGFIHSNGSNTRGLVAQDVSDFHRKLLQVSRRGKLLKDWYTLCQLSIRKFWFSRY